jgi:hypothetical protein
MLPKIILQPLVSILIVLITVGLAAGQTLLFSDNRTQLVLRKKMNYTVKKGYRFYRPHPSGGVTNHKLFLAGNNLIIPCQGEFGQ